MRSSVDFPQPDGPRKQTNSPASMSRLMLRSAVKSPKRFSMLRILRKEVEFTLEIPWTPPA